MEMTPGLVCEICVICGFIYPSRHRSVFQCARDHLASVVDYLLNLVARCCRQCEYKSPASFAIATSAQTIGRALASIGQ